MIRISGRNAVYESIMHSAKIYKAYLQKPPFKGKLKKIEEELMGRNISIEYLDRHELDKFGFSNHQGVVIEREDLPTYSIDDLFQIAKKKEEAPFFILLDEIEDPHNFGAIVRTAEAAGVHGIIVPKRRSAPVTDVVFNASAGAINYLPVVQVTNLNRAIEELKQKGLWIYGTSGQAEATYYSTDLTGPMALVIGNEGRGMRKLVEDKCDFLISIPLLGQIESLNASAAAAIVIYEVVRQRNEEK